MAPPLPFSAAAQTTRPRAAPNGLRGGNVPPTPPEVFEVIDRADGDTGSGLEPETEHLDVTTVKSDTDNNGTTTEAQSSPSQSDSDSGGAAGQPGYGKSNAQSQTFNTLGKGSSFIALGDLASIILPLSKVGSPADSALIEIVRAMNDPEPSLATVVVSGATLPTGPFTMTEFVFTKPALLVPGTTYFWRVSRTGAADASNYYQLGLTNAASGQAITLGGSGAWITDGSNHYMYRLPAAEAGHVFITPDDSDSNGATIEAASAPSRFSSDSGGGQRPPRPSLGGANWTFGQTQVGLGESFVAKGDASFISVWLRQFGAPTDSLIVEIAATVNGPALATSSSVLGSTLPNSGSSIATDFAFANPVTLAPGTTYFWRLRRTGAADPTNRYFLGQADTVNADTHISFNGTTWVINNGFTNDFGWVLPAAEASYLPVAMSNTENAVATEATTQTATVTNADVNAGLAELAALAASLLNAEASGTVTETESLSTGTNVTDSDANGATTESVAARTLTHSDANGATTESATVSVVVASTDGNGTLVESTTPTASLSSTDNNGATTETALFTQSGSDSGGVTGRPGRADNGNATSGWGYDSTHRGVGSSFVALGDLTSLNLRLGKSGTTQADSVLVEIAASINGSAIATSDPITPSSLTTVGTSSVEVSFAAPVSLTPGVTYYWRLIRTSGFGDLSQYYTIGKTTSVAGAETPLLNDASGWAVDSGLSWRYMYLLPAAEGSHLDANVSDSDTNGATREGWAVAGDLYNFFQAASPSGDATASDSPVTLGLAFTVSIPVNALSVRFFVGDNYEQNRPIVVALYQDNGGGSSTLLTQKTLVAPDLLSLFSRNWYGATFDTPVALTPGNHYVAAVLHSNTESGIGIQFSYVTGYFPTNDPSTGPLVVDGGTSGRFHYASALAFPDSQTSTNYLIDVDVIAGSRQLTSSDSGSGTDAGAETQRYTGFIDTNPTLSGSATDSQLTLGVEFTASGPTRVIGVRWWADASFAGSTTQTSAIGLWANGGGIALLSKSFPGFVHKAGWNEMLFDKPVDVSAGQYVLGVFHEDGKFSYTSHYFFKTGVGGIDPPARGPIELSTSDAPHRNGRFDYGSSLTYPSSDFNETNYWHDVIAQDSRTTVLATALSGSDSGTAVETESLSISGGTTNVSSSDVNGTAAELVAARSIAGMADVNSVATESSALTTSLAGSDTSTATETVTARSLTHADANAAVTEAIAARALTSSDVNGTTTEAVTTRMLTSFDNNGTLTESTALAIVLSSTDANTTVIEAIAARALIDSQSATATEASNLAVTLVGSDVNATSETSTASVALAGVDANGITAETPFLAAVVSSFDASTATADVGAVATLLSSVDANGTVTEGIATRLTTSADANGPATELSAPSVVLVTFDAGSVAEAAMSGAALTSTDSAAGTELSANVGQLAELNDHGVGVEMVTGLVVGGLSSADSAHGADAGTPDAQLSGADAAAATDASALTTSALAGQDAANATDATAGLAAQLAQVDAASGADALALVNRSSLDAATAVDGATLSAQLTSSDAGAGMDVGVVALKSSSSAEAGQVSESAALVAVTVSLDTGAGVETIVLAAAALSTDVLTALEATGLDATLSTLDAGTAAEAQLASAAMQLGDAGTTSEAGQLQVALSLSDVGGQALEVTLVVAAHVLTEAGATSESQSLTVSLAQSDLGATVFHASRVALNVLTRVMSAWAMDRQRVRVGGEWRQADAREL